MYIADLLSRNFIKKRIEDDNEIIVVVHVMKKYEIRMSKDKLDELKKETETDEVFSKVLKNFHSGWIEFHKNKKEC